MFTQFVCTTYTESVCGRKQPSTWNFLNRRKQLYFLDFKSQEYVLPKRNDFFSKIKFSLRIKFCVNEAPFSTDRFKYRLLARQISCVRFYFLNHKSIGQIGMTINCKTKQPDVNQFSYWGCEIFVYRYQCLVTKSSRLIHLITETMLGCIILKNEVNLQRVQRLFRWNNTTKQRGNYIYHVVVVSCCFSTFMFHHPKR